MSQQRTAATTKASGATTSTLTSLFRHFIGIPLTVELKTGRSYQGILSESDAFGNLTLEDAVCRTSPRPVSRRSDYTSCSSKPQPDRFALSSSSSQPPQPPPQTSSLLSLVHIRGPTIRYIHFPSTVDVSVLVRQGMDRERAASQRYARGKRPSSNNSNRNSHNKSAPLPSTCIIQDTHNDEDEEYDNDQQQQQQPL